MTSDAPSYESKREITDHKRPEANNLNMVDVVKPGDFKSSQTTQGTAYEHLPHFEITSGRDTVVEPPVEAKGNTIVRRDRDEKINEYDNGEYTLAKHDDGKWYYHQNGDGHQFVEVDGNSIKMNDEGKVTYNESGLLGKDNQTLGDGSTGLMSSLTSAAAHVEDAVVNHPLDTFNKLAFMPLTAVDAIAGTHTLDVVKNLEIGAADEVIHHPGEILKDVAIGAGIAALTVATGGGFGVALAVGAATAVAAEAIKNKDNKNGVLNGMLNDAKNMVNAAGDWAQDAAIIGGTGNYTNDQRDTAAKGLQDAGAFGAQTIAGVAGGVAGGMGAAAAGLDGAIPNAARSLMAPKEVPTVDVSPISIDAATAKPSEVPAAQKPAEGPVTQPSEGPVTQPAEATTAQPEASAATPEEAALKAKVDASVQRNQAVFNGSDEVVPSIKQAYNVRFEKVTEPTQVQTLEGLATGETQTANPGDWIATRLNADGTPNIENGIENKWTIKENKIAKTYQVTPEELQGQTDFVAGTRTDAPPVQMVQLKEPLTIDTPWGSMSGKPGDYLANYDFDPVTGKPGSDYAIVTKTSYDQTYKPVAANNTIEPATVSPAIEEKSTPATIKPTQPGYNSFTESNTTFSVRNNDDWKSMVSANGHDDYGAPILTFANDWATKMEKLAGDGPLTREIVDQAASSAEESASSNGYGMSGFSFSIARNALTQAWSRGEEFNSLLS